MEYSVPNLECQCIFHWNLLHIHKTWEGRTKRAIDQDLTNSLTIAFDMIHLSSVPAHLLVLPESGCEIIAKVRRSRTLLFVLSETTVWIASVWKRKVIVTKGGNKKMSYRTYLASNKFISLPFAKFSVGEIASSISDEQTGLTRCLKSNADEMGKKAVTWQQSKSARSNNVAA